MLNDYYEYINALENNTKLKKDNEFNIKNIKSDQVSKNSKIFRTLLKQKLQISNKLPERTATWLYPSAIEKKYNKDLKKIINKFIKITISEIKPNIRKWLKEFKAIDNIIIDQAPEELESLNQQYKYQQELIFDINLDALKGELFIIAMMVAEFNKKQWQKIIKSTFDIEYTVQEPWLTAFERAWVNRNVNLIKGLTDDYIKQINEAVLNGFVNEITPEALAKELSKINRNFSKNRTKLIARDQIGKLNSVLTRRRQLDAGVDQYIWNTAIDERVRGRPGGKYPNARPTHWTLEGKLCKWNNSRIYSDDEGKTWKSRTSIGAVQLPPGTDIQCRCFGNPFFSGIINEIKEEIKKENKGVI